jgi:hypothetical protein
MVGGDDAGVVGAARPYSCGIVLASATPASALLTSL